MKRHLFLLLIFFMMFSSTICARELPYIYKGIRPMGMGGAFVALSDDGNALFYNPAGLSDVTSAQSSSILTLELESNTKAYDMFQDAADIDFDNEAETGSFLRKYIGDTGHSALSVFPHHIRPNFAFGVIGTAKANLQPRDYQYPRLLIDVVEDAAVCVGYAQPVLDGSFLVGFSAKYLFRKSIYDEYTVSDITSDGFKDRVKDDFENGSGALLDIGVIYKIGSYQAADLPATIQIGMSANNLIGSNLGDAEDLDPHVDLGVSTQIGEKLTVALDYVDLFGQMGDDDDSGKRIHLGLEYFMTDAIALRAGLNQGYPTFGFGFKTKKVQLDLLSYAEEIGAYAGQRDDRRYLLRMGFGF